MLPLVLLSLTLGAVDSRAVAVLVGRRTSVSQADAQTISQTISVHLADWILQTWSGPWHNDLLQVAIEMGVGALLGIGYL